MSNAVRKARKRAHEPFEAKPTKVGTPYLQRASTLNKTPRRIVSDLIDRGDYGTAKAFIDGLKEQRLAEPATDMEETE